MADCRSEAKRVKRGFLLALLAALPAGAQQTHVVLDTAATEILFTLSTALHNVHGSFELSKGDLWFDSSTGQAGGRMMVSAASGQSGNHSRDSRMQRHVLEAMQFPEITFEPDRIDGRVNPTGDSVFQLHGAFQIHGAAHGLTMQVKSHIEGGRLRASADFDVPYVRWGMKDPSALFLHVDNTVKIEIQASGSIGP
jgi:polyisoprenoid-binding protein YceI